MAIEGPLRELGIHDVFQLLDLSRKTGRLRVTSALRDNEGTVFFKDGRVVSATIRSNPHPLGAILLDAGRVTEGDLARARIVQQEPGETRKLGAILVAFGDVTQRELERLVRRQVETVVFELMSWQEGFFSFAEVDLQDMAVDAMTTVSTESLLMEGARRIDEWAHIQQRIPHLGAVLALADLDDEHPSMLDLLPNEWETLAAIDGEADLRAVAAALGRSEFEVAKIAFGLLVTGVLVLCEAPIEATPAPVASGLSTLLNDARAALRGSRASEAQSFASTAVSLAPDDVDARVLLARALFLLERESEGEEELRRALEIDPRNASALMEGARLAARHGELRRAIALWQRVMVACPDSPLAEQARLAISHASRLSAVLEAVDA